MSIASSRIATFLLVVLLLTSGCAYHSGFSDQELIERFRSHEAEFKKLVQMIREDTLVSYVTPDGAYQSRKVKATISPDRLALYHSLISRLRLNWVEKIEGKDSIYFALWNKDDIPYGGSNEYFIYAETPPAEARYMVDSIDPFRNKTDACAFKKIQDRWYLHLDNW